MIKQIKHIAINTYLIAYVFIFTWWLIYPCPVRTALLRPVADHVMYWGLWQAWGVFSPNISRNCITLGANIIYNDGSKKRWEFPRPEKFNFIDQMFLERYRKFGYDHASRNQYSYMWPDYARYVARMNKQDNKKIVSVELYKYWWKNLPFKRALKGERDSLHYTSYFTYQLKPEEQL